MYPDLICCISLKCIIVAQHAMKATTWGRALSRALGQARVTRRRSVRWSAAGAGRLPAIPVCGSGLRCADRTRGVSISHTSRTVHGEVPRCSPFHTRATKDDGKSAITTSRFPGREGRARPVCRWARELPLTHPEHDRLKSYRLATGRRVEAMAAPAYVESRRRFFFSFAVR